MAKNDTPSMASHSIKLSEVMRSLTELGEDGNAYFNRRTGEVVYIRDEAFHVWQLKRTGEKDCDQGDVKDVDKAEEIAHSKDYVMLPDRFDIDEWGLMQKFAKGLDDRQLGDRIERAILGAGAFGRFDQLIETLDLKEDWRRYRLRAYKQFAKEWCEKNQIHISVDQKK